MFIKFGRFGRRSSNCLQGHNRAFKNPVASPPQKGTEFLFLFSGSTPALGIEPLDAGRQRRKLSGICHEVLAELREGFLEAPGRDGIACFSAPSWCG